VGAGAAVGGSCSGGLREAGLLPANRSARDGRSAVPRHPRRLQCGGPTILATNDWDVVAPDRFYALGLVSFNINPHYKEADPAMAPERETRVPADREYHVANANPVVGLEEGALVAWTTVS
jgi:dipeptidase E